MSNSGDSQPVETGAPPTNLKALGDRLGGSWTVSGEAAGETTWEWMEGVYTGTFSAGGITIEGEWEWPATQPFFKSIEEMTHYEVTAST